ncbi:hypothetical protein SMACR_12595 [Sordaria macrospora]|uniref:WGS project CABT00000000 data, contig 2.11 n=2 Tax=Sordaria macrospora TaxID=5147 RepID=F7VXB2_SORMK|nr:uncharacterized protein SMAC_12595 [Sordaria macrospora k-hell]KAA8636330.1 hypothetical protein SMACR_12595 [Sordaria macrospora]WPJ60436.1 hypothetical protein SMAC4_12595 [Sordaria macrospora]CCC10154.1 unnamed protein product [Sordaria macrospora k-hell]
MAILTALQGLPISNEAVTGALVVLVTAYIVYSLRIRFRLSHIPGPWHAGFTRLGFAWDAFKSRQPQAAKEYHDKYGRLVRIAPNLVLTDDPDATRQIMGARSKYTRSAVWYSVARFDPDRDTLFNLADDDFHTLMRKKMAPGYFGKENDSIEAGVDDRVVAFIKLIEDKYLSTAAEFRPMDLASRAQYFTVDVISALAFGKTFGCLEKDADLKLYVESIEGSIPRAPFFSMFPEVTKWLYRRPLRWVFFPEDKPVGLGPIIGVAKRIIEERFTPDGHDKDPKRDMLASFMRHGISPNQAVGEAVLQMVAGSDTSATLIRTAILHLLSNHVAYRRLQAEIDRCLADGTISNMNPSNDSTSTIIVKDSEGRRMPYLQAVIKESLRMAPPAAQYFPRVVPPEGDTISGFFVPGGTEVGYTILSMCKRNDIFGEDAHVWRPERWLECGAQNLARMNGTVDLVFNHGKWQCLGKHIALMEFNKIFIELFKRFDMSIVDAYKPAAVACQPGLYLMEDFWIRITRRESDDPAQFASNGVDLGLGEPLETAVAE